MPAPIQLPYLNRFQPLAYLLVFLALSAFAYSEPNFPLFLIGAAATALSWWLVESDNGKPLPRPLINLGVLAASAGLYYELVVAPESHDIRQANLLMALGHFMAGILICKLFERKSNRDYAQILTLTLLLMVAGAIVDNASLFYAVLLALYLALGLYVILVFHLRSETQRAVAQELVTVQSTCSSSTAFHIRKDIRFIAAWSAFLLVTIAAIVFLVFPRSPSRNFLGNWGGGSTTTGFSEQVTMTNYVNVQLSDAPVMEVKLEQNGANLGTESYEPYFRGAVLDTYNTTMHEWLRTTGSRRGSPIEIELKHGEAVLGSEPHNAAAVILQTYTMRNRVTSNTSNLLYTIAPPLHFASDQVTNVLFWDRPCLIGTPKAVRPLTYKVTSAFVAKPGMFRDEQFVRPGTLGRYFENGTINNYYLVPDKVVNLAHALVGDLLSPDGQPIKEQNVGEVAKKFQDYLRTNYPYSLRFHVVDTSVDPLEDFLLNRKGVGGHCECFAGAMVMLCRSVGINARMATGYHGGEFNSLGGFYLVREKDAHAWVEVFVPERGWAIFDPTPAGNTAIKTSELARWFQEISQLVQKGWLSTVVAFDNTSRKYLFNSISSFFDWAGGWTTTALTSGTAGLRELLFGSSTSLGMRLYVYAAIACLVWLASLLTRRIRRRRTSQLPMILKAVDRKTQRQLAHELMFFDDFLRLLSKTGHRKRTEQTPREYVEQLAVPLGGAVGDARWLVRTFYDIRFGTVRVTPPMRDRIANALQNVRNQLHR